MFTSRASRRCLLIVALTLGLVLAPLAPASARPSMPPLYSKAPISRPAPAVEPRQPERLSLLRLFWSLLAPIWAKDGAHLDPFG